MEPSVGISEALRTILHGYGLRNFDEQSLRETLEQQIETYTLFKLAPWPARRWKCRYRLMMRAQTYDAQTASEAYALALIAALKDRKQESSNEDHSN